MSEMTSWLDGDSPAKYGATLALGSGAVLEALSRGWVFGWHHKRTIVNVDINSDVFELRITPNAADTHAPAFIIAGTETMTPGLDLIGPLVASTLVGVEQREAKLRKLIEELSGRLAAADTAMAATNHAFATLTGTVEGLRDRISQLEQNAVR